MNHCPSIEKHVYRIDECFNEIARTVKRVDIPVGYGCNRRCCYCPVSADSKLQNIKHMQDEVFTAILEELARFDYSEVVTFHFYNEPLLRRDLNKMVARARSRLPNAILALYTNGDILVKHPERFDDLTQAGVDRWVITRHDKKHLNFFRSKFASRENVKLWEFSSDFQMAIKGTQVVENPLTGIPCWDPTETLVFTPEGHLLPCCNDPYEFESSKKNITETGLANLWEQLSDFRKDLTNGNRRPICARCDNVISCESGSAARHAAIMRGQPIAGDEGLTPMDFVLRMQNNLSMNTAQGLADHADTRYKFNNRMNKA